jgi:hypothetical protein
MRFAIASLLAVLLNIPAWATQPDFPEDVTTFLVDRESCDHWRGEDGYDAERKADIDWSICESCTGTDEKLLLLKKKYHDDKSVMAKLNELESQIEPKDKAKAKLFCSTTRKPSWYEQ